MSAARPAIETSQPVEVPRLLVELPSRRQVFLANLRDIVAPRHEDPLELRSAPAAFWPDVFVKRALPWDGFLQSGAYHLIVVGLLMGFTHLLALQPTVVQQPVFEHSPVVYYQPSEYLPPLDTRSQPADRPRKADPEVSRQPIISVPAESDNHEQTIVTPPKIHLRRNVAMPNIVAWSDTEKPRLAIPPAPLTPAAEITRIAPKLENSVVTPPPDAARLSQRRASPALQNSVVAPPPELRVPNKARLPGLQPDLIAPPPSVESSTRSLGQINIAPSAVIAPAPQLPVASQRSNPGGKMDSTGAIAPQVVPPPPSLAASGTSDASFGSRGRVIALNLHSAVGAPPDPPAGNRRGAFAATAEGHAGAPGSPGSATSSAPLGATAPGTGNGKDNGNGSTRNKPSDLPGGLYVGTTAEKSSPVTGPPENKTLSTSVNPNLMASVHPPRVSSAARPMQPADETKLSPVERTVFGNRKFYAVTLNMPNLNSSGGSWVIRFAELNHDSLAPGAPSPDLSQPMATHEVDPAYPLQLMRENVAGTVILYAVIHADGSVADVKVLRGVDDRLDRFASEAVAQWKFEPATKNGSPVDVEATFQIPFRPARVGSNF